MSLRARIEARETLLLDGGLGSALIARGLPRGVPPERWVLERPEAVVDVHRSYVAAGCDAVHACTFGANPLRLAVFGLNGRCEEINGTAVDLARQAGPRFVIADAGPTGEYLPPVGHGDPALWRSSFERQGRALAAAGADAIHIETMSDLREARIAVEAFRSVAPDVPILVSLTFDRKKRGFFTIMGDPVAASLRALFDAGATAVGANCSITSREMKELMVEAAACGAPLVAQPNAGTPLVGDDGRPTYGQTPEEFAADMADVVAGGVALAGGCCGTDDRFLAALAARLGRTADARS